MTGANGRLGRVLAKTLVERGMTEDVTLTTRNPAQVGDLAELGFRVVAADFADPASLEQAFAGAETLMMISATGPAAERIPLHRNAIDAAARAGVPKIVYTSRVTPLASSPYPFSVIHDDSEAKIKASGMAYTFLRDNEFSENLDPWLTSAAETGELHFGAKGKIAFICRADVIASIVAVLCSDGHEDKVYELSGPEALDRDGIAAVLSEAVGRPVVAPAHSREEFGAVVAAQGRPDFVVNMFKGLYDASAAGEWSATSKYPELLMGRPATSLSDYIRAKFAR